MIRKTALTGGMGVGKSTTGAFIASYGVPFVSADDLNHKVLYGRGYAPMKRLLGPSCLKPDGNWDKTKIAQKIFTDSGLLSRVENILHPLILQLMDQHISTSQKEGGAGIVFEVPLLFEKNLQTFFDDCVVVAVEDKILKNRLKNTPSVLSHFEDREKFHLPQSEKLKRASHIVWNNGSLEDLSLEVKKLLTLIPLTGRGRP